MFVDWMTHASCPQEVVERFRKEGFGIGSNKAFMYARALIKGRIILVSEGLTEEQARSLSSMSEEEILLLLEETRDE